jgi:hypothetical protein
MPHAFVMMMGGMSQTEVPHVSKFEVKSVILVQEDILVEGT